MSTAAVGPTREPVVLQTWIARGWKPGWLGADGQSASVPCTPAGKCGMVDHGVDLVLENF